jgi:PIN domain nuclease of toxin-antitoxin system
MNPAFVDNNSRLTQQHRDWIAAYQADGLGDSIFSCWEIAKLVEKNRLGFSLPLEEWITAALAYPGVQLLDLYQF